jgi:hypothetical protein
LQHASDLSGAIVHDAETEPVASVRPASDADPVVPDPQPQAVRLTEQGQANVSRPPVPHGIANGFLSDAEQLRGRRMIG